MKKSQCLTLGSSVPGRRADALYGCLGTKGGGRILLEPHCTVKATPRRAKLMGSAESSRWIGGKKGGQRSGGSSSPGGRLQRSLAALWAAVPLCATSLPCAATSLHPPAFFPRRPSASQQLCAAVPRGSTARWTGEVAALWPRDGQRSFFLFPYEFCSRIIKRGRNEPPNPTTEVRAQPVAPCIRSPLPRTPSCPPVLPLRLQPVPRYLGLFSVFYFILFLITVLLTS